MKRLSVEWFRGVENEKKEECEKTIRNSVYVLSRLQAIIKEWENELDLVECKISDYISPSWDVRQAHRNGDRARIRRLRELLSFLPDSDQEH